MEIAGGMAAYQVLLWIGTLLACLAIAVSLLTLSVALFHYWRGQRLPITRRHSVIPDHPVPPFPPYAGL